LPFVWQKGAHEELPALVLQAAAALKARSLAQTEEKQIQSLITQIVKRQLTKLQSKLANFEKVSGWVPGRSASEAALSRWLSP
jgi:hypothetical protein